MRYIDWFNAIRSRFVFNFIFAAYSLVCLSPRSLLPQKSRWVAVEIVKPSTAAERAVVMAHMIELAVVSARLRNYNAVFEVVAALHSTVTPAVGVFVSALAQRVVAARRATRGVVAMCGRERQAPPRRAHRALLVQSQLQAGLSSLPRHRSRDAHAPAPKLREALTLCAERRERCLPYIGVFLTDQTFVDESRPNFVDVHDAQPALAAAGDQPLLNFAKARLVAQFPLNLARWLRADEAAPPTVDADRAAVLDVSRRRVARVRSSSSSSFALQRVGNACAWDDSKIHQLSKLREASAPRQSSAASALASSAASLPASSASSSAAALAASTSSAGGSARARDDERSGSFLERFGAPSLIAASAQRTTTPSPRSPLLRRAAARARSCQPSASSSTRCARVFCFPFATS